MPTMIKACILLIALFILLCQRQVSAQTLPERGADLQRLRAIRIGLQATIGYMDTHPELFPPEKPAKDVLPDRQQRMLIRQAWQTFLDQMLTLDVIGRAYSTLYKNGDDRQEKGAAFMVAYGAFVTQYRFALDFLERTEKNPDLHVILNEPVPELGLAGDNYADFKFRFLNALRGAEFARLNLIYEYYRKQATNPMPATMAEDIEQIWQAGKGVGPALTLQNAIRVVGDLGFTSWYPVQKEVARTMGNIKVWRQGRSLISPAQISDLAKKLQPGDILLERREWYASNVGIPGFWAHAALYIGTPAERRAFFSDPGLQGWLREQGSEKGDLEDLLAKRYPKPYARATTDQEGHAPRVVEAIEEGVTFTTLEHSAAADSLAVLRPRLPARAKALAVIRALHYSGRPYDFNFDFLTDAELVCSELIYKAYEPGPATAGLALPVSDLMGRKIVSPNDLARLYAEEAGRSGAQFELISFLDGHELGGKAVAADSSTFMTSWQRPKWHIWMQGREKSAARVEE